ncbi:MAG: ABC transporter ATP-binding protein/permease [Oscillospiraceae bacterium]|jgi:ATP-binding cassette subfamily B protein|nr:ABC transporter ATP-binding protein/permease [Oscillospiraceae bacterium]
MKEYMRVLSYAGEDKRLMPVAMTLLTFSVLFSVAPFFIVGVALNAFLDASVPSMGWIAAVAAAILVCLVLKNIFNGLGLDLSHKLAYKTLAGMRRRAAAKLMKMSMGDVQAFGAGSAKKVFVENIEEMELILAHSIPEGFANIIAFLAIILTMFCVDWRMALAGVVMVVVGMIPFAAMMVDGMKRMNAYYGASETMTRTIIEYISGMEVVKVFGQQSRSFKKYSESVYAYRDNTLDWYRAAFTWMTTYAILLPAALLTMLPLGVMLYTGGTLSLPALVISLLLGISVGLPAVRIVSFFPQFPQLKYKSQKIESMFAIPDMEDGSVTETDGHSVSFENVTFSYGGTDVIRGLSLVMPENSITALVGESGAGKSTLAKLIMRFWDVQEGAVKIGGVDLRDLTADTLMGKISYVSQDNFLFNASIAENIRHGKPGASNAEIIEIAKAAQCHEFISEMPDAYDTIVGASGDKLSGGQKQRICIARAMLKNAPIVILDEAMSFADPENEDRIQEALSKLIIGKTVIIIAHRLSTITDADNIVLISGGEIAAQGRHAELLENSSLYGKLWNAHIESMDWDIGGGKNA